MEVHFDNIVKRYGDVYAVKNLSLKIISGALHFLLGPSGCGKTTTLRMLAGLETPSSGRLLFDGKDVTNQPAAERGIGMVFQNYALWPHMTVRKNIEYGLKLRKLSAETVKSRIDDVLEFTQLRQFVDRYPGQLSGGQQQRVALARALAIRPSVLLLDEPLSNLDAKLRLEMRDNISRIHKQTGITTVYVTHDQKEALSMGTSVSVMRAGVLVQTDTPKRLYHHPASAFIAGFIGETNLLKGKSAGAEKAGDGATYQIIDTDAGRFWATTGVAGVKIGEPVTLSIRPEAIAVDFRKPEGKVLNSFETKLEHLTYLGELEQLQLRTRDNTAIKASVFNAPEHNLQDGDAVTCHIAPEDVLVLPGHADLSSGT